MNRREFGGHLVKGAVGLSLVGVTGTMGGCNVFTDIETWVPVGIASFESVVALLQSAGIINPVEGSAIEALITTIKAGFAQIIADANQYKSINPPPVGLLEKLKAAMEIVVTNIQAFLNSINVSNNPIIALVTGLITIILSTISAFQGKLPASVSATPVRQFKIGNKTIPITPINRSNKQFIADFNAACIAAGHPEAEIH